MPVRFPHLALLAPALMAASGCATQTISPELRFILAQPVECSRARDEVALLRQVRPDSTRQTLTALGSVTPPGLAGMVVTQDYENRRRYISGEHGADIDRRIAAIQTKCGPIPVAATTPGGNAAGPAGQPQPAR